MHRVIRIGPIIIKVTTKGPEANMPQPTELDLLNILRSDPDSKMCIRDRYKPRFDNAARCHGLPGHRESLRLPWHEPCRSPWHTPHDNRGCRRNYGPVSYTHLHHTGVSYLKWLLISKLLNPRPADLPAKTLWA